jgi:hypothetical protein
MVFPTLCTINTNIFHYARISDHYGTITAGCAGASNDIWQSVKELHPLVFSCNQQRFAYLSNFRSAHHFSKGSLSFQPHVQKLFINEDKSVREVLHVSRLVPRDELDHISRFGFRVLQLAMRIKIPSHQQQLAFTPFIPGSQFLKIKKARAKG